MADQQTVTQTPPAGTEQVPGPEADDAAGPNWGRVLDVAGVLAGVLLIVIVADIWTDGRVISRWLLRHRGQPQEQEIPVEPGN